jgi:NAD(P)-dependent dehydrogenase (short-subunit alcohol dehydrogenase family)
MAKKFRPEPDRFDESYLKMKTSSGFVLVTGVSTGIGNGIAKALLKKGYQVIGSVRSDADKMRLRQTLGNKFHPLVLDVTDEKSVADSVKECEKILGGRGLAGLINNAGVAFGGPIADMSMKDIRFHFEVNVFGLLNVTKAYLPLLGAREHHQDTPGRIINITSVAGKFAAPFLGPYAGSKYAVEGLSDSLRRELLMYGIDVIVVGPGNVITPIWDKGVKTEEFKGSAFYSVYKRFADYAVRESKTGHTADEMGELVANVFADPKPRTRYAFVKGRFKNWTMPRLLPARMIDKMIGKQLGMLK